MQDTSADKRPRLSVSLKTREQAAYDALREALIAGRWQPGESLVISRLALDLGMSRIPVTNAVKQLASEGFVRVRPHQEAIVAPLIAAEVREIYLMRAALEALALAEAATKVSPEDLAAIKTLNEQLRQVKESPGSTIADARAIDRAFHERMRDIAAMPHLSQTLRNLADQCEYYRACLLDRHHFAAPTPKGHEPLIEALERNDPDQLRSLMSDHILQGMHLILEALEEPA